MQVCNLTGIPVGAGIFFSPYLQLGHLLLHRHQRTMFLPRNEHILTFGAISASVKIKVASGRPFFIYIYNTNTAYHLHYSHNSDNRTAIGRGNWHWNSINYPRVGECAFIVQ